MVQGNETTVIAPSVLTVRMIMQGKVGTAFEPSCEKPIIWKSYHWSVTDQPVQSQKKGRSMRFWI